MNRWMKFYYVAPTPDRLVDEVRAAAASGELDLVGLRQVREAFLGRVMAANPERIAGWFSDLAALEGTARDAWHTAAWMSGTREARQALRRAGARPKLLKPPPDVLTAKLDPSLVDVLWGFYFATGDARAVRRVIGVLDLREDHGAAARFAFTGRREDRQRAINDAMFTGASTSLRMLMREHPPLVEMCERILETATLTSNERVSLEQSLRAATQG